MIEKVFLTKIDWYVQPFELLSSSPIGSSDSLYTCLLSYIFYHHCSIDYPVHTLKLCHKRAQIHRELSEKKL